jgi:uncharacterized membrane protein
MKNPQKHNQHSQQTVQLTHTQVSVSPLPSPNDLERYEVINPGFANRLMQMAEKEQEHRMNTQLFLINTEKTLQTKDLDNIRRGQIFALVSVVLVLLLCAYIAYAGQAQEAKWVAVSVIVGLAGVFITGRLKNSDKKQK